MRWATNSARTVFSSYGLEGFSQELRLRISSILEGSFLISGFRRISVGILTFGGGIPIFVGEKIFIDLL
jgi:hypothetical protein